MADSGSRGTTRRGRGYTRARAHAGAGVVVAVVRERLLRGGWRDRTGGRARGSVGDGGRAARDASSRGFGRFGGFAYGRVGGEEVPRARFVDAGGGGGGPSRKRPVDMGSGSSGLGRARVRRSARADGRRAGQPRTVGVLHAPPPAKSGVIIPPGHSLLAIHESGVVTCCVPRRVPTHCGVAARGVPAGTLGGVAASGAARGCRNPGKRASRASHWEPARRRGEDERVNPRVAERRGATREDFSRVACIATEGTGPGRGHAPCAQTRASRPRRRSVRGFRRGRGHAVRSPRVSPSDARRTMAPPSAGCG